MGQKIFFFTVLIVFSFFVFIGILLLITSNSIFDIELNPAVTKEKMISNYQVHEKEITSLKNYFNSITPNDMSVSIEYASAKRIDLKIYYNSNSKFTNKTFFAQWDINPYDYRPKNFSKDSLEFSTETNSLEEVKQKLRWTDDTFKTIKKYLDKANCISVTNGEPCNIGFGRSGMGMYFYNVFSESIASELKDVWNDSCKYIYYNDKLVLEYGGGVIGPDCFPDP